MPEVMEVVAAFDRSPIETVAADGAADLDRKLEAALAAFRDRGGRLPVHRRVEILETTAARLAEQREAFALMIAREGGKPLADARVEVDRAVDGVGNAAHALRGFGGEEIPMGYTAASAGRRAFTVREPIGVVAAISAFNHPLNLIVHQVAPAVAVGAPVVVKPAHQTPLSCLKFVALLHEAGLPEPWCQTLITADTAVAERLATDSRIAFLSFIGSARVGWSLRRRVADGVRIALEHGGAAPAIIDRTADVDRVIEPLAKGGYYHAGQVCVSTQRILVHEALEAEFTERFAARVAALRVGDPSDASTEVGPLIHPREADRVEGWIAEALAGGAERIGGGALSDTTLRPSIVRRPPPGSKLARAEVFGPVTTVQPFATLEEAIAVANDTPFAFQSSLFTRDLDAAWTAAEGLDASAVMINDHTAFRTDWMPFAGRRASGYGTGGIPYTMRDFTEEKMIVFRR